MIHAISLAALVKKSFKSMTQSTKVSTLADQLSLDPTTSGIDVVVLQEKDVAGLTGRKLVTAINSNKHPDVDVIYFYKKETNDILSNKGVHLFKWGKPDPNRAKNEIQDILSKRRDALADAVKPVKEEVVEIPEPVEPITVEEQEVIISEPVEIEKPEPVVTAVTSEKEELKPPTIEERIISLAETADFEVIKQLSKKDSVMRELMDQNYDFSSASEMLELLDQKIMLVFQDMKLTPEEKFSKIRDICLERSTYKGLKNSLLADKYLSIIQSIIETSEKTVDYKLTNIKMGMDKFAKKRVLFSETDKLNTLMEERLELQIQLRELSRDFLLAYKAIDTTIGKFIEDMLKDTPSDIPYVNAMLDNNKTLFTPENTKDVFNLLTGSLQSHRISASAIEDKIEKMVDRVFQLLDMDNDIIEYQQRIIDILKVQRVEDVVVIDNMIKRVTRLVVGTSESGKTATALCRAKVRSRQANTILLSFSKNDSFEKYGISPVTFSEFIEQDIEKDFIVVRYDGKCSSEDLKSLVQALKMRLSFYKNIYFLADVEDEDLIHDLVPSALTINYVTNGSGRSIDAIKKVAPRFSNLQIGHQVTMIDPPLPANVMLNHMELDPLTYRVNILPAINYVRQCSLQGRDPSLSEEVSQIYLEAFRQ